MSVDDEALSPWDIDTGVLSPWGVDDSVVTMVCRCWSAVTIGC